MHRTWRGTRWIAVSTSSALLLLGSAAFLAWALWAASSRYTPLHLPLVPGSGVCFLALGAGLLGLALAPGRRQRLEALVLGAATALFGYLALLECMDRPGWRMSELFLLGRNDPILSQLVRMTPTVALDFVLGGLSLVVLSLRVRTRLRPVLVHALGAVPLATGFVGLVDAGLHALGVLEATRYEAMSPLTALGFVCLSVALLATLQAHFAPAGATAGVRDRLLCRVVPWMLALLVVSTTAALVAVERGWIGAAGILALTLALNGLGLTAILSYFATHFTRALWLLRLRLGSLVEARDGGLASETAAHEEAAILREAGGELADLGQLLSALRSRKNALTAEAARRRIREMELEAALRRAREASQAKSEFLSNMSHEVRTPLNGILGMTELLLTSDPTPQQRDNLYVIRDCARDLLSLLTDVLDLSNLERGRLEICGRRTDLRQSLDGVVRVFEAHAASKGLRLSVDVDVAVPQHVVVDAVRLRQVLMHLVANAVRFTERGEVCLRLDVRESATADPVLAFSVTDTGAGIPPEQLERIFEPFTQGDGSIRRRHGGAGLGLAIASRLVERMGGRLEVESRVGSGSRFAFALHCTVAAESPEFVEGASAGGDV